MPRQMEDSFELDGVQTPRIFLSARNGEGLQTLRQKLSQVVITPPNIQSFDADFPDDHVAAP